MTSSAGASAVRPGSRSIRLTTPAKINLALEVLRRRDDGYHDVATILQAVSLYDDLWITERPEPGVALRVLPRSLDVGPVEENLVTRAAARFFADWPGWATSTSDSSSPLDKLRGVDILLRKRIPAGAGMGGGSSDAAATLVGLVHLARAGHGHSTSGDLDVAGVPDSEASVGERKWLHETAASLGSDVPFFLEGATQLGTGRGEVLSKLPFWPGGHVVLVFPNVVVATSSIYGALKMPLTPPGPLATISHRGISGPLWMDGGSLPAAFRNDLEPIVVDRVSVVAEVLDLARSFGDRLIRVTGSGSGVFCVCPDESTARRDSARFRKHGFWARTVAPVSWGVRVGHVHRG